MDNKVWHKAVWVLLLLLGLYYIFSGYQWYTQAINDAKNPNSTIFFSPNDFLLTIFGGVLIAFGGIVGLNVYDISDKLFRKNKSTKIDVIVLLVIIGFYLATLQPTGVMTGLLQ